jgi:type I restriction enzyme S subunit
MSWPTATIGDVCVATEQADPARSGKPTFRYVDIAGIDRDAKAISKADELPCDEAPSRARKVIEASDILVSTVRPNLNAIASVPDELDGEIASTGFAVLRANRELLNPKYLYYWVQYSTFIEFLVANATGASYPAVSDGIVKRAPIPLPPPKEQSQIVQLLEQADVLRRLRREADAKAARILPALFLKMFGDPASNPMDWPVKDFADTFRDTTAGNEKLQSKRFQSSGKLAVIDQGQEQIAGYTDDESLAYAGSLPAIVFGDHTRIFKFVDHPFVLGADGVRVLTAKESFNSLFAYWHCQLLKIQSAGYSRHFKYLKEKSFIYPDEALQNRFGELAQTVMAQIAAMETAASKIEALHSALLERAFSGQLTAKWRQSHVQELLAEMQQQAKALNLPMPKEVN